MLAGVRSKYGVVDGGRSGHSVTRREIERLYSKFEPAKLNHVASLCLEHGEGALLKMVREQYAEATPESTPRHVEQLDEDDRRRYGGVVLTDEREHSCTVFKMQMAVVGGTKSGFMLENAPLTAASPRFEVEVVTDESGRIEHDEQMLAQMSEIGAFPTQQLPSPSGHASVWLRALVTAGSPTEHDFVLHLAAQSASDTRRKC
jgi:hypothetical protein